MSRRNSRHETSCRECIIDLNGTRAAIAAGYGKNNGKPKKPDARKISKKLKLKHRKLIAHYTDPTNEETFGNGGKSAIAAGYSETSAISTASAILAKPNVQREIERIADRELNHIFDAAGVTIERLAKGLKQALDAKEKKAFIHQKTGNVVYSKPLVAHDTRLRAIRLAADLRGDMAPKEINFNVSILVEKLQAARRRQAERVVEGEVVKEEDNNRPEADNLSGAPQAEEKTQLSE
jgi:phage terminase small subunit